MSGPQNPKPSPAFRWQLPLSPNGVGVRLVDGGEFRVRPVRATDKQALKDAFERLSPDSRYRRFFTLSPQMPDALAERLTHIDHKTHRAWVVGEIEPAAGEEDEGIGVARLITDEADPSRAEAAFAVMDEFQGRGIGQLLLDLILSSAAANGIETIYAEMLSGNKAMRGLFQSRGAEVNRARSTPQVVCLDLEVSADTDPTAGALYELLRLV